jgi:RNA polymerase sigma-70 factor (ECF subfamily)
VEDQLNAISAPPLAVDPADRVTLDDSIRMALLVVLQQLTPAERAVFVLHDLFQFSFDAIAKIVGRSPAACRQLASRARKRVEAETGPARFEPDTGNQHRIAQQFIAACAGGDIGALLALLAPDTGGDIDFGPDGPVRRPVHGHHAIARTTLTFYGPTSGTTLVSQPVNGHPGILAFRGRELFAILQLKARDGIIYELHGILDPAKLAVVQLQMNH